jgi:oligopeptide transport system substrate-binding protein
VRQAFSAAIDRQTIVDSVTRGGEIPATTYAPPGIFGAVPPEENVGQGYDPELAKAKLQEFLDEKGMTIDQFNQTYRITYGTTCTDFTRRIQQAIAAMFKETLGVDTDLQCQEGQAFTQTIKKETPVEQTYHIHSAGWNVDYPDQSNYVSWYHCEGENFARRGCADANCTSCQDTEFDRVIEQADSSSDAEERQRLYYRAEEILFEEEFAWAPVYWRTDLILTKPWLTRDFPPMRRPNFQAWTIDWAAKQAARQ